MLIDNLSLGVVVGLAALIIASISDLKTREVPDWLNFSLSFFAIGYAVILSIFHWNASFIVNSAAGLLFGLGIGLLMFYTGQWGGGDSKLIIGLSAILGLSVPYISDLKGDYELLIFLANTLFVGAVYGLAFSAWKAVVHFSECKAEAIFKLKQKSVRVAKIVLLIFMIISLVNYMLSPGLDSAFLVGISIVMMAMLYMWILISCVEKVHMIRKIKVSGLTEGDWVVETVMKGGKTILKPNKTGVTTEDIGLLKKNKIQEVTIKVGIPFVPSFLIAYILMMIIGNWLVYLF
ncbi:prepilin peptidase [Candidatus Woesearchaeota archaeon]|nr:prepilin peptidase [Candidatus Woesearchaeota archaeon]